MSRSFSSAGKPGFPLQASLFLGLILASAPNPKAWAGHGGFDPLTGKFNVVVSLHFDPRPTELDSIRAEFEEASALLLDATDGTNQLGLVMVVYGDDFAPGVGQYGGSADIADYWVYREVENSRNVGGHFGEPSAHVEFNRGAATSCGLPAGDVWPFVIVHESSHHIYGLADEYVTWVSPPCTNATHRCDYWRCCYDPDNPGTSECIVAPPPVRQCFMEDRCDYIYSTEFCWMEDHDHDHDTLQECYHCKSCRETIRATRYGASLPSGEPEEDPPVPDPVGFIVLERDPRIILVIDRSGSMAGERFREAKRAAQIVVDLIHSGFSLGVVSFTGTTPGGPEDARIVFPLTTITGPAGRFAAKLAIEATRPPDGGYTNYSAGLQKAHSEFIRVGIDAANQSIIFLSDGENNRPSTPPGPDVTLDDTMAELYADLIVVNTIGIGNDLRESAEDRLRGMAEVTAGEYFRSPLGIPVDGADQPLPEELVIASPLEIKPDFARCWARGEGLNENLAASWNVWGTGVPYEVDAYIDSTTTEAVFLATWRGWEALPGLDFRLRRPDLLEITPNTPGVSYTANLDQQSALYKISGDLLLPGEWKLVFSWLFPSALLRLPTTFQVFSRSADIWGTCRTQYQRPYLRGEDIVIEASAYFKGTSITGTGNHPRMWARGWTPEGGQNFEFLLKDNGDPAYGDEEAGDGLFSGRIRSEFLQNSPSGSYAVCVDVSQTAGSQLARWDDDPDLIVPQPWVPSFTRTYCTTVVYDSTASVAVPTEMPPAPSGARILAAVPNPFRTATQIRYEMATVGRVRLDIYGVNGRLVRRLLDERAESGIQSASWDGCNEVGSQVASGVYWAVLRSGGSVRPYKLLVVR